MGTSGSWPNYSGWLNNVWGSGMAYEQSWGAFFINASNLVFGQNPPYFLDDFQAMYPKFFGAPTPISGCAINSGSNVVIVNSNLAGMQVGQFVQAPGVLLPGSVVLAIGTNEFTVSTVAGANASNFTAQVYQNPPLPMVAIQAYLCLAYTSLVEKRWGSAWCIAMGWFIAHYCTLYCQTDESSVVQQFLTIMHGEVPQGDIPGTAYTLSSIPPGGLQSLSKNGSFLIPGTDYTISGTNITLTEATVDGDTLYAVWPIQTTQFISAQPSGAQIAAQGLAGGIQTSKSVGDVSVSYQPLESLADWGAWNLTKYGQQLATMAAVIGSGPMVIW